MTWQAVVCLSQSCVLKNIWWLINEQYPPFGAKICSDICLRQLSVPRSEELWGTDNVQGQISKEIFAPNGGYCLYYPSNIFKQGRSILETFSEQLCRHSKYLHSISNVQFYLSKKFSQVETNCANTNCKIWKLGNITWGIYKQYPPFGKKICLDICLRTLSVPRSEQFSKTKARGKLWASRNR